MGIKITNKNFKMELFKIKGKKFIGFSNKKILEKKMRSFILEVRLSGIYK